MSNVHQADLTDPEVDLLEVMVGAGGGVGVSWSHALVPPMLSEIRRRRLEDGLLASRVARLAHDRARISWALGKVLASALGARSLGDAEWFREEQYLGKLSMMAGGDEPEGVEQGRGQSTIDGRVVGRGEDAPRARSSDGELCREEIRVLEAVIWAYAVDDGVGLCELLLPAIAEVRRRRAEDDVLTSRLAELARDRRRLRGALRRAVGRALRARSLTASAWSREEQCLRELAEVVGPVVSSTPDEAVARGVGSHGTEEFDVQIDEGIGLAIVSDEGRAPGDGVVSPRLGVSQRRRT